MFPLIRKYGSEHTVKLWGNPKKEIQSCTCGYDEEPFANHIVTDLKRANITCEQLLNNLKICPVHLNEPQLWKHVQKNCAEQYDGVSYVAVMKMKRESDTKFSAPNGCPCDYKHGFQFIGVTPNNIVEAAVVCEDIDIIYSGSHIRQYEDQFTPFSRLPWTPTSFAWHTKIYLELEKPHPKGDIFVAVKEALIAPELHDIIARMPLNDVKLGSSPHTTYRLDGVRFALKNNDTVIRTY